MVEEAILAMDADGDIDGMCNELRRRLVWRLLLRCHTLFHPSTQESRKMPEQPCAETLGKNSVLCKRRWSILRKS